MSEAAAIRPERLVFVGGLHRSGTTPITRLLGTHDDVSVFSATGVKEDEGQHLQSVYPSARAHGGPGRFAHAPAAHLTETDPRCTPDGADALLRSWTPHWDLSRRLLVEKSPPNLVMTRFLRGLFPGCRLVISIRHPIVVALSTRKWSGPLGSLERLVEHWLAAHETFERDAAHLASVHVVHYERLVADPRTALDALGVYLGLTRPLAADLVDASRNDTYLRQWAALCASRSPFARRRVAALRDRFADRLAAFGYDFDDLSLQSPTVLPGGADG